MMYWVDLQKRLEDYEVRAVDFLLAASGHVTSMFVSANNIPSKVHVPLGFVVMDCTDMADPVFLFWKMRHEKMLASEAYFVFLNVQDSPSWKDLVSAYGGFMWGENLFLMRYRESGRPGVLPSQRGMYMQ